MKEGILRRLIAVLLMVVCISLVAGCKSNDDQKGGKDILTVSLDGEPLHLAESLTTDYLTVWAATPVNDYLVKFDDNLEVIPAMCKSIEQTDDLTFEFEIYDGIKFHNGRKVTAEDVKFSLEYVVDKNAASALAVYFECLDNVEVTGELTGKIHLKKVYAPFLNKLTACAHYTLRKRQHPENSSCRMRAL